MIKQGQVFKLKAKGANGEPLWAYRYRLEGRGSGSAAAGWVRDPRGGAEGTVERGSS
jgi:hypothetical protein